MTQNCSINLNSSEFHSAEKSGIFGTRVLLLEKALPYVMSQTAQYLHEKCSERDKIEAAHSFMAYDLEDAFQGTVDAVARCGFFPYAELSVEYDNFLTLLLMGRYKSCRDSLRRLLEVTLCSVVFLSEMKNELKAREWISSKSDVPFFKQNTKDLLRIPLVNDLDVRFGFIMGLKKAYWGICDYCHTKGINHSTRVQGGNESIITGVEMPKFSEKECLSVVKQFLDVIGYMTVLLVVHNNNLLVGVDVDEKFGFNGPISGYFGEIQVSRLLHLMPPGYAEYFIEYSKNSEVCEATRKFFEEE